MVSFKREGGGDGMKVTERESEGREERQRETEECMSLKRRLQKERGTKVGGRSASRFAPLSVHARNRTTQSDAILPPAHYREEW